MIHSIRPCPDCGSEIPANAPEGLCPHCLLEPDFLRDESIRIRCAYCHHRIELVDESEYSDVTCPSCGSRFGLIGKGACGQAKALPTRFGRFVLEDLLGQGSVGDVYRAYDHHLDRLVAIKIPRQIGLTIQDAELLLREAKMAARLNHPNIVSVHEVGQEGDRLFIVCEFIDGQDLAQWLTTHRPDASEAVRLCVTIADALQHAHDEGVIHRDLKPSNILLSHLTCSPRDSLDDCFESLDSCRPFLTDFGLAKPVAGELSMTLPGKVVGTPAYMSPEQAIGDGYQADARSDVYSLGVILYELLTHERPFRGQMTSLLQQIAHDEPPRPKKLNPEISRDLETICLKCLEKAPSSRYQSANALAEDLRRLQRGDPILANPITGLTRALRWCRRHPSVASLSATVLVCLIAIATLLVTAYWTSQRQSEALQRSLYLSRVAMAGQLANEPGGLARAGNLLDASARPVLSRDYRDWEWYYLNSLRHRDRFTLQGHVGAVETVVFSPDGSRLASAGFDGQILIWDSESSALLLSIAAHEREITSLSWNPDGTMVASGGMDGTIHGWNAGTGRKQWTLTINSIVNAIAFDPMGNRLAVGADNQLVTIWDIPTQTRWKTLTGHTDRIFALAWSPDGRHLASCADNEKSFKVWELDSATPLTVGGHDDDVRTIAWSPDGDRVITGSWDFTARVWDARSVEMLRLIDRGDNFVNSVAWSSDGHFVATAGENSIAHVWDVTSGQLLHSFRGHTSSLRSVCFHPTGKLLATASTDAAVKIWELIAVAECLSFDGGISASWSPDNQTIVTVGPADLGNRLHVVNVNNGRTLQTLGEGLERIAAFSPDGQHVVAVRSGRKLSEADLSQQLVVYSLNDRRLIGEPITVASPIWSIQWHHAGTRLLTSHSDNVIRVWDLQLGRLIRELTPCAYMCRASWSPNGQLIAAPGDGKLRIWEAETGKEVFADRLADEVHGAEDSFGAVWKPDGSHVAAARHDGSVVIWDVRARKKVRQISAHSGWTVSLAWNPSGTRLATGGADAMVRIWDCQSGQELLSLSGHNDKITDISWSPNGKRIAAASWDGVVNVWDASRGYPDENE